MISPVFENNMALQNLDNLKINCKALLEYANQFDIGAVDAPTDACDLINIARLILKSAMRVENDLRNFHDPELDTFIKKIGAM